MKFSPILEQVKFLLGDSLIKFSPILEYVKFFTWGFINEVFIYFKMGEFTRKNFTYFGIREIFYWWIYYSARKNKMWPQCNPYLHKMCLCHGHLHKMCMFEATTKMQIFLHVACFMAIMITNTNFVQIFCKLISANNQTFIRSFALIMQFDVHKVNCKKQRS